MLSALQLQHIYIQIQYIRDKNMFQICLWLKIKRNVFKPTRYFRKPYLGAEKSWIILGTTMLKITFKIFKYSSNSSNVGASLRKFSLN